MKPLPVGTFKGETPHGVVSIKEEISEDATAEQKFEAGVVKRDSAAEVGRLQRFGRTVSAASSVSNFERRNRLQASYRYEWSGYRRGFQKFRVRVPYASDEGGEVEWFDGEVKIQSIRKILLLLETAMHAWGRCSHSTRTRT